MAVQIDLLGTAWGDVQFFGVLLQFKFRIKRVHQLIEVVSFHRQPAASGRRFWRKHSDNQMSARFERLQQVAPITLPLLGVRQEVKYGPIMPYVVLICRQGDRGDIPFDPCVATCSLYQPSLSGGLVE